MATSRRTWSRLAHTSWDELVTRVGQEISKRRDWAAYRMGLQPADYPASAIPQDRGKFFFARKDIPRLQVLLREQLPGEVGRTLAEAEEICGHRFRLLGYDGLDYGRTIDWHLDLVSGKRAPLKPWFRIHFLDFEEVGDHKVIWELNRHQHLVTLAKAWHLSQNKAYVDEAVEQLRSWWQANPYPIGINWASTLEVAFRSLSWLWLRELLTGCEHLPSGFESRLLSGLANNGRHIERYLSTYFSPNTHLLGEAVGLFFIGTLCPQLPAAKRWQKKGWQILLREADRQVRDDGVYFEQSLYYHVYALDFFLHARILAARNGFEVPQQFDAKLESMLEVLRYVAQAGPPEAFGDDDGGRVFNPRRNRTENLTDPLALGATLYERRDFAFSSPLTEEAVWLFGDAALSALGAIREEKKLHSAAFPAGGLYVMADDASRAQLVIDAGPQGTGRSGHGHTDALEVLLSARNRRWLVDSGTGSYISASGDRNTFRGTAAHNTLRVDSLDQAIPEGPFAWSAIPHVKAELWIQGDSFDFFSGSHDGYARLSQPVTHRRYVLRVVGAFWLVRDVAEGAAGTHEIEINWHFASDLELTNQGSAIIARPSRIGSQSDAGQLAILPCHKETAWSSLLTTAQISPAYGQKCAAPCVSFGISTQLPNDFAVLLIPAPTHAAVGEFVSLPGRALSGGTLSDPTTDGPRAYRYQAGNVTHHFLFSDVDSAWKSGSWVSDAKFMYYCLQEGQLAHFVMVEGSHANWQGVPIVKLHHKVDRFERIHRDGILKTSCSESGALEHNFEGKLTCFDTVVQI